MCDLALPEEGESEEYISADVVQTCVTRASGRMEVGMHQSFLSEDFPNVSYIICG